MHGYHIFHRRYWPVLQRLPDPPPRLIPRLRSLGYPPREVWVCAYRYLDRLRARWRL